MSRRMQKTFPNGTIIVAKPHFTGSSTLFEISVSWSPFSTGPNTIEELLAIVELARVFDAEQGKAEAIAEASLAALGFTPVEVLR